MTRTVPVPYGALRAPSPDPASVTLAPQADRTVLTPHALTATIGGGGTSVVWTSSTGNFDDATLLSPTYTPATIGQQVATCTPSGPLGAGAPATVTWAVTRPVPSAANANGNAEIAALAPQTEVLSETAGADGVTWSTTVTRVSDGAAVAVVDPLTTTPDWTPNQWNDSYDVESVATDAYARTSTVQRSLAVDAPPIAPGAAPAREDNAAGTTTSGGTTFNTPTGGSGSYTHVATLSAPVGSLASLAGTGLGPYTISTMADGESYTITLTSTDDNTANEVKQTAIVSVAQSAGFEWVNFALADATLVDNNNADNGSSEAGGTITFDVNNVVQANPANAAYWHKPLLYANGDQAQSDEPWTIYLAIEVVANPGAGTKHYVVIGIADDASLSNSFYVGLAWTQLAGNPGIKTGTGNGTVSGAATRDTIHGQISHGIDGKIGVIMYQTGNAGVEAGRNSNTHNVALGSTGMHIFVAQAKTVNNASASTPQLRIHYYVAGPMTNAGGSIDWTP